MIESLNFPLDNGVTSLYGGWEGLRRLLREMKVDGVEGIWSGSEPPEEFPRDLLTGYHLTFYPDWLDFYQEDEAALRYKYGTLEAARRFYGGWGRDHLMKIYKDDLARAIALGAKYVVFHVSDVSIEEGYTYRWLHSHQEVVDASLKVIGELLAGVEPTFDFLVENQWWPGFTFTDPAQTEYLLEGIAYPRKGIMLDTGHLMNCNTALKTQRDGLGYIRRMVRDHGALAGQIKGLHLHQSLSGKYVRSHTGCLPQGLPTDPVELFGFNYAHILKIDRHRPWTEHAVYDLVQELAPQYLTHELAGATPAQRVKALGRQKRTLEEGRLARGGR